MAEQEALFIKGFNGGYLLEQYEPNLLAKVLKDLDLSNDYLSGLSSGQKEYQMERIHVELENVTRLREQGKDHDREI